MNLKRFSTLAASALLFAAACSDDKNKSLEIPATYDGSNYQANAQTELAVLSQLGAFISEMGKANTNGVTVTEQALIDLYEAGNPSLADITTAYYDAKIVGTASVPGWAEELALASGGTYTVGTPQGNGGTLGSYLFDENGLEIKQVIEKGLFGAALYNHAVTLMSGEITEATVDRLVATIGMNPAFRNTSNGENADRFMAVYVARRTNQNDANGFYNVMRNEFIRLQAAVKAGNDFTSDRNEALATIKENWEKANAATVINYCLSAISTLSNTNLTDSQISSALHAYGEGVGFLYGWKTIPQAHKIITDAQIDALLTLMNAPANGTPTSYTYVTDAVNQLPKLQQVVDDLAGIYDFTDAQVNDFRLNWINEQGR